MTSVLRPLQYLKLLSFVLFGALLYANTLQVPFLFDDQQNILQNSYIRIMELDPKGLYDAAFKKHTSNRPVSNTSFALNYYFHRYHVMGYHLVNICIHILAGILLFRFVEVTLELDAAVSINREACLPCISQPSDCWGSKGLSISNLSLLAALLWLVHPVQTQSVTYVVQRMTSMAAMFYVLSLLLYIKGRLAGRQEKRLAYFSGTVLAGFLAIGSKETAATLPFFILLYEWYFFQDLSKKYLRQALPYLLGAALLLGLLVFCYLGPDPIRAIRMGYADQPFSLLQRVMTEFRVVMYYLSLLLWPRPTRLNLDYDFVLSRSWLDP
ncbi:MAG: hypothetical protein JRI36_11255, partial [Deltaproteobacteria bacterium]|nr:hypothetical protein [Deltaproteobacteria bacterium]